MFELELLLLNTKIRFTDSRENGDGQKNTFEPMGLRMRLFLLVPYSCFSDFDTHSERLMIFEKQRISSRDK